MKHEATDYNVKFGMAYLMIEIYVSIYNTSKYIPHFYILLKNNSFENYLKMHNIKLLFYQILTYFYLILLLNALCKVFILLCALF